MLRSDTQSDAHPNARFEVSTASSMVLGLNIELVCSRNPPQNPRSVTGALAVEVLAAEVLAAEALAAEALAVEVLG